MWKVSKQNSEGTKWRTTNTTLSEQFQNPITKS